jgi:hypothetical protein
VHVNHHELPVCARTSDAVSGSIDEHFVVVAVETTTTKKYKSNDDNTLKLNDAWNHLRRTRHSRAAAGRPILVVVRAVHRQPTPLACLSVPLASHRSLADLYRLPSRQPPRDPLGPGPGPAPEPLGAPALPLHPQQLHVEQQALIPGVAVHVAFRKQIVKPVFHLIRCEG